MTNGRINVTNLQGLDLSVPAYLRYDIQVRNRHLCLRDTVLLITDIWREKTIRDADVSFVPSAFSVVCVEHIQN